MYNALHSKQLLPKKISITTCSPSKSKIGGSRKIFGIGKLQVQVIKWQKKDLPGTHLSWKLSNKLNI